MGQHGIDRRTGWVLFGCLVCQLGLGCSYFFGATLKHIVSEFEWSRAAYAASMFPLLLGYAVSAPLVGRLTERIGARGVISSAVVLLSICFWVFSQMQSLWQFYLTSFLLGVSLTGLGDIPVGAVVSRWVGRARGLALGLVYSGSNLGGAVVPLLAATIAARSSWRDALVVVGGLALVVILPFSLGVVRDVPVGRSSSEPEQAVDSEHGHEAALDVRQAMGTRSFWILAAALFSFYFYYLAVNVHLIVFLSDAGYSDAQAAAQFGGMVGIGILAKLGMGAVADRIRRRTSLLLNFALVTLASFLLLAVGHPSVLLLFLLLHGLATAAENVTLPLIVSHVFGVRHFASIYGALMVTLFPGGALGSVFAGAVFDQLGSYRLALVTFALLNLVSWLLLLAVRREVSVGLNDPRGAHGVS